MTLRDGQRAYLEMFPGNPVPRGNLDSSYQDKPQSHPPSTLPRHHLPPPLLLVLLI